MNQDIEKQLALLSQKLKPGEIRQVGINPFQVDGRIIVQIHTKEKKNDSGKVIEMPFTAHRSGDSTSVIRGTIDCLNMRAFKKMGTSSLVKNFVARQLEKLKQEGERLKMREDDLNQIYYDSKGRAYEMIDGIPTYIDDRGFDYYLKYDRDGNEFAWVKLTDGTIATFLDPDRTVLQIGDKAYYFDGEIHFDQEMDTLYPHQR